MGSRMPALARPVRKPPNSCLSTPTAPRMRRSISLRSKRVIWRPCPDLGPAVIDGGRGALPFQDLRQAPLALDGKQNYRNPVVSGKGERGAVHDAQILLKNVVKGKPVVAAR